MDKKPFSVYLVNPGNDNTSATIVNDACFLALNVLELGTWLQTFIPDIHVECRDGQVMSNDDIIKEIREKKPSLVGISVLSTSYQNSLAIAKAAKEVGAKVVFGNDQASETSHAILQERPYVDYVLCAEFAEKQFELLIRHLRGDPTVADPEKIETLTYRGDDGTVKGFDFRIPAHRQRLDVTRAFNEPGDKTVTKPQGALDVIPLINWHLYPKSHYEVANKNFRAAFGDNLRAAFGDDTAENAIPVILNNARGCSRQGKNRCEYCSLLLRGAFSTYERFWAQVKHAHEQIGANVFYEVCDSISSFAEYIRGVAAAKPADLGFDPKFFIYAQAGDIVKKENEDLIRNLKKIGVFRINMGLDSGHNTTLQHLKGNQDSVEKNEAALRKLKENGITVYGSLVLGSEAETPETLAATVAWAKKLCDEGLVAAIEANCILPLPGSNLWEKHFAHKTDLPWNEPDTPKDWPLNTDKISKYFVSNYSGVTYNEVIKAALEIREYAKQKGTGQGSAFSNALGDAQIGAKRA